MEKQPNFLNQEQEKTRIDMLGVSGRLLLDDKKYLDQKNECTKEQAEKIPSFENRSYQTYIEISNNERRQPTRNRVQNDAIQDWTDKFANSINTNIKTPIIQSLSSLFRQIGISEAQKNFTKEDAELIYKRYCSDDPNSNIKTFISDVLQSHTQNNVLIKDEIYASLASYEWLAHIFGKKSSDIIAQLISAETELKTNPQFLEKLTNIDTQSGNMRINSLTQKEKEFLSSIEQLVPKDPIPDTTIAIDNINPVDTIQTNNHENEGQPKELPIMKYSDQIKQMILSQDNTIIIGGTGCGKTMKIPQMIRSIMKKGQRLIVTEPRQINTSVLARKIAEESNVKVGKEIGYQHGGEKKRDEDPDQKSDTVFLTEGTLLQMLKSDDLIMDADYIMIDEVHVRSEDTEVLIGYLKAAQEKRKERGLPSLKIIATSATVDKEELEKYFGEVEALEVEGQPHDIEDLYWPFDEEIASFRLPYASALTTEKILKTTPSGDIIIFVAGIEDIYETEKEIRNRIVQLPDNTEIIRLHSGISEELRKKVEEDPVEGHRRIIIATNFAETGITINGLEHVIDTGEENEVQVDEYTGFESITRIKLSQAGCLQRRGRVGRNKKGTCHHLYTKKDFERRQKFPTPEIKRINLSNLILSMKEQKIEDISSVKLLSSPLPEKQLQIAYKTLQELGALDENNKLTVIGHEMSHMPTDFIYARMILEAVLKNPDLIIDMCTFAAMHEKNDFFTREALRNDAIKQKINELKEKHKDSDLLFYIELWKEYEKNLNSEEWVQSMGIKPGVLERVADRRTKLIGRANGALREMSMYEVLSDGYNIYSQNPEDEQKVVETKNFYKHPSGEIFEQAQIFREYAKTDDKEAWANEKGLSIKALKAISKEVWNKTKEKKSIHAPTSDKDRMEYILTGLKHRIMKYHHDSETYHMDRAPYQFRIDKSSVLHLLPNLPDQIVSLSKIALKPDAITMIKDCQAVSLPSV